MAVLKVTRVTDRLTVSPQPEPEDFPAFAARGVQLVINNRPDGEEPGQLSAEEGGELASKAGMGYRHIPVRLPELGIAEVEAFSEALGSTDGPVHAHCRSGVRSATLWALSEVMAGRLVASKVGTTIEAIGFDPKPALAWLAAHPERVPK